MFGFGAPAKTFDRPPIGLLAGGGRFPILFAEKARSLGLPVVCVGINDEAPPELVPLVERFYWAGLTRLGRMIRCFKSEGVQQIVMAGKIHKVKMNTPFRMLRYIPDWRGFCMWYYNSRKDNKDDSLLLGVIAEFEKDGMTFASALEFCPELLVKAGLLTRCGVSASEEADIAWSYLGPLPDAIDIRGLVCFYNERVDIEIDGQPLERARTRWSPV